ncbi:MAG: flagellar biosynthesis repressor FlbT [Proteobacteria bacterium]|nr:flagellar biosynthesis repressor FlbT [Pseudomonadota bacterium]
MALIIDLKPSEVIIIGTALVTNDAARTTRLHIEGNAAILREKDILREADANTPCKKIYLAIQLMYLSANPASLHQTYFDMIRSIQKAAPSTALFFAKINDHLLNDDYYKALKEARHLMEHEQELLANAS